MWDRLITDCHVATMVAQPGNPLGLFPNAAIGIHGLIRAAQREQRFPPLKPCLLNEIPGRTVVDHDGEAFQRLIVLALRAGAPALFKGAGADPKPRG